METLELELDKAIRTAVKSKYKESERGTVYLKFTNVSKSVSDTHISKGCRSFFDEVSRALMITVTGAPHQSAASVFGTRFLIAQQLAGLDDKLITTVGSARVEGFQSSKEPDGTWEPINPGRVPSHWPSVVLEVAFSESAKKLCDDAEWWLTHSNGQVNLVITIRIHQNDARMTFQAHEPIQQTIQSRRIIQTNMRQEIIMSRPLGETEMPIVCVPNEPLRISCRDLLLRDAIPPEKDPNISVVLLERIARDTWRKQGV
ncbi:hypothetical protein N7533_009593 [Penicillium manginii]|uniref:uncharacterized protein n=1 Tax=Penicillium manginii TaxID=203109 RepID=UPI00254986E3|nr:uncharacterized protein N7533_009593 [Penicillium manginii]KAJ5744723.1 hypothetical protein N7533_009593 [Penicillium manginii]